ncbi:MAG: ribonuclease E inhibitor RraB [Pirellulales bacterium]
MANAHYQNILANQLAMNRQTWVVLERYGVTESSMLRLDFTYYAPSREAAAALSALLQQETDYDVSVAGSGWFFRRRWLVQGTTQPTAVSPTILDQWVTWMVAAGAKLNCDFDGWGTAP